MPPHLQFERADFGGATVPLSQCARCGRPLQGPSFEFTGRHLCATCAGVIRAALPEDSPRVFWRSVGVGLVAATALALMLAVVLRRTASFGWLPAIAAIGIGWSVGRVMQLASRGAGGRRYQIAGTLLVYTAIVIPIQIGLFGFDAPLWVLPFLDLRPIVDLFIGLWNIGSFVLFLAFVGVRWTWIMLRGGPRVTERKVEPEA